MKRLVTVSATAIGIIFISQIGNYARSENRALPDDGTYKEVIVKSFQDCEALCAADAGVCRGAIAEQPDTSKPEMFCRLNNGFGATPAFPSIPPEDLSLDIAVAELNSYRAKHGLGPVTLNEKLNMASRVHAEDLAKHGIISHTGTDGSGHGDRIQRQGYYFTIAGENVATGQKSWPKVFEAWQKSPGHNENLLRDDVTEFGIALVYEPTTQYQTYWAMLVASPMSDEDVVYFKANPPKKRIVAGNH